MKAVISDRRSLEGLSPVDVASYLRAAGWSLADQRHKGSLWESPNDRAEVLLPTDRSVADFASRMADLVATVSAHEDRSQLELFRDFSLAGHDVVRVRAVTQDSASGTISVDAGTSLIANGREMLMAAAAATAERRSYFPTRKPASAVQYMERVRLGPSEPGSYVITMLSPVSPHLRPSDNPDLGLADPFERKVTLTLARSLEALRAAVGDAASTGSFDSFYAAIGRGLTANLCSAIVGMTQPLGPAGQLDVALSWSPARPLTREVPARVRFLSDSVPVIREAADIIRESAPIDDYHVYGLVVGLDQRPREEGGRIRVLTVEEATPRTVRIALGPRDYQRAIRAHEERTPVRATGQLRRQGVFYQLEGPHDFGPLEDDS